MTTASAEIETQAAMSGRLPTWGPPQGTQIFILLSVQQKVWKKVRLHTSTKTAPHCLCWCCFSRKFFIWLNKPTCTTSNTDRQARPSCQLPDITLPDMMTFVALALQMGHEFKYTLHWLLVTGRDLRQLHNPFYGKTMTQDRFLHILRFLHFADNSQRPDEGEEYDWLWKLRTVFDKLKRLMLNSITPRCVWQWTR